MVDLWADENEPVITSIATEYIVTLPRGRHRKISEDVAIYVQVETGPTPSLLSIQFDKGNWMGRPPRWDDYKEIRDWLIEWELAESRQIGPEDSELFATEKMVNNA